MIGWSILRKSLQPWSTLNAVYSAIFCKQGFSIMSQEIFTFWNGDSMFAVEVSSILSTQQYLQDERPLPVSGKGLKGAVMYRNEPTPIFDFAESMGLASPFEENQQLIQMLVDREQDHIGWMNALENSIVNGSPFEKATDPHKCAFGKWYDKFHSRDEELTRVMKKFDVPHKHIHSLAKKLLNLRDKGETKQALAILSEERLITMSRLLRLFEEARGYIVSSERPVVMFVTKDGVKPLLGLVINEISDVHVIEPEDIMPLESISIGSVIRSDKVGPMVKGFIKKENLECLLLEPERLLEVA